MFFLTQTAKQTKTQTNDTIFISSIPFLFFTITKSISVLVSSLTFGVLLRQAAAPLGFATSTASMAASAVPPTLSQPVHTFVA